MISISAAEVKRQKNAYQIFFGTVLAKWGIKSPFKLNKEKMAQFFSEVKEGWAAEKALKPVSTSTTETSNLYTMYTYDTRKLSKFSNDTHDITVEFGEKFGIRTLKNKKNILIHAEEPTIKFYITEKQVADLIKKSKPVKAPSVVKPINSIYPMDYVESIPGAKDDLSDINLHIVSYKAHLMHLSSIISKLSDLLSEFYNAFEPIPKELSQALEKCNDALVRLKAKLESYYDKRDGVISSINH